MITYSELRRISLDFRRLSSNFLNSTDDNAATMIQRFKKYIDDQIHPTRICEYAASFIRCTTED